MTEAIVAVQTDRQPSKLFRWIVLLAVSFSMGGNYYVYDSINPLERIMHDQLGFSASMFGALNTSYSVAAVLTLLLGGIIIDRFGLRRSILFFSSVCMVGALVMALRASFGTMVAGRAILGFGAESQIAAITTALARWFKGKELSFALGINLTVARLASVAADNSPTWAAFAFYPNGPSAQPSWHRPLWLAAGMGALCVLGALIYWALEASAEQRYSLGQSGSVDQLDLRTGLKFNPSYWYTVVLCFLFYAGIFPFRTFAIDLFTSKLLSATGSYAASGMAFAWAQQRAGNLNSVLPLSAMVATPLFGLLSDKIGKRATLMMLGSLLLVPVYLMIGYTHISLLVPTAMMGVAFSLVPAVMWPSVAYIVDERRMGTAYALMGLMQQVGFAIFNYTVGRANDFAAAGPSNPRGFLPGLWIFSILGFLGLLFAYLLRRRELGPEGHGLETIMATSGS